MPRPIRNLRDMEIDEVSLVDKGANQHAMITIAKRATEEDQMPDLYSEDGSLVDENALEDGDIVFDGEGNAYEFEANEEGAVEEERELQEVGKSGGGLVHVAGEGSKHAFSNFARQTGQRVKRGASKHKTGLTVAGAGAGAGAAGVEYGRRKGAFGKSFSEEVMEELSKAYTDDERDTVLSKAFSRIDELQEAQAQAEEIAKSERDLRLTREYISKAADYNVPIDPQELGPVLYRMAESMSYDDCAVIHKALETAGEILFDEVGFQGGGDNGDIMSQVEMAAVEIGKSASPENVSKVFDDNPMAYDEYLAAQRDRF